MVSRHAVGFVIVFVIFFLPSRVGPMARAEPSYAIYIYIV